MGHFAVAPHGPGPSRDGLRWNRGSATRVVGRGLSCDSGWDREERLAPATDSKMKATISFHVEQELTVTAWITSHGDHRLVDPLPGSNALEILEHVARRG